MNERNGKTGWVIGVMGIEPVPRQSQSWVNQQLWDELLGNKLEKRINYETHQMQINTIPCVTGLAAAKWAAMRKVRFELYMPWSNIKLPVALKRTDPFVHDDDAPRVVDDAADVHVLSSSKEFSAEAMSNARKHLMDSAHVLIVTHDGRNQKGNALTLRARNRGTPLILLDWRKKKVFVINKEALPDEQPEPF